MKITKVFGIYFSPTGGTKYIIEKMTVFFAHQFGCSWQYLDITPASAREKTNYFSENDLVIMGFPVYAGRIPNKLLPVFTSCFVSEHTLALPVCVYGNRNFDDALLELKTILEQHDFCVTAAMAAVSEHAFSSQVGTGRPDENDEKEMIDFSQDVAHDIMKKTAQELALGNVNIPGDFEHMEYYIPRQEDGSPAKFLKAKPVTDHEKCDQCGICAMKCPMNSISLSHPEQVTGICIKCQACIKYCPKQAKHFDDPAFLSHVRMLEKHYQKRADNVFYRRS
jgi:NAD-dependent dihydropyrimidine dehydrogenase PreA subunit